MPSCGQRDAVSSAPRFAHSDTDTLFCQTRDTIQIDQKRSKRGNDLSLEIAHSLSCPPPRLCARGCSAHANQRGSTWLWTRLDDDTRRGDMVTTVTLWRMANDD